MYTPTTLIPENDISISPKKIYNIIKELLEKEIEFYSNNNNSQIFSFMLPYVAKILYLWGSGTLGKSLIFTF